MTDGSGSVVWSAEYTVFGKAVVSSSSVVENNLWFPGQYYDNETGLHYNFHRYYDSETGRYITADPIGLEGGMNLFIYTHSNPLNKTDALGLICDDETIYWELIAFDRAYVAFMQQYEGGWGPIEGVKYWFDPKAKVCVDQANDLTEYLNSHVNRNCCHAEFHYRFFPLPHADVVVINPAFK